MESVHFSQTRLDGGFWGHYEDIVRNVTVPAIYAQFAESGRFAALECQKDVAAHIYWDSDTAKWIESVAYLTQRKKEPALEAIVDEAVEQIVKNQLDSGYFNSYYIPKMQDKIFTNRDNHELYCAGHLIEAAIAYDRATGKDKFLKAMIRYVDYIYQVFCVDKSAAFVTPGHEEIELALLKLAEHTGDEKYRELAAYFIDERGKHPMEVYDQDREDERKRWSTQSMAPVRQMTKAYGHAVRAGYLYTAMADLARQSHDDDLLSVCKCIFKDIVDTKISITGGVGAQMYHEAYGPAYRLPNRDSYNETCAAISLMMFAWELQRQDNNSKYADIVERILFNGMISGMSLAGDAFFYENALEIDLRDYDYSTRVFKPTHITELHDRGIQHERRLQRAKMFSCSCCPPNVSRMLASITRYMYTVDDDTIYCHQFASSKADLTVKGQKAVLQLATNYPADGKLTYHYSGPDATLAIRIPDWCVEYSGVTENGYAMFQVHNGSVVELTLPMEVHFVEANPHVSELAGKYAVTRGPIVYCMESIDNGEKLWDICLKEDGEQRVIPSTEYGVPTIEVAASRRPVMTGLYQIMSHSREKFVAKLIPYFAFANRGVCDMQIWTQAK